MRESEGGKEGGEKSVKLDGAESNQTEVEGIKMCCKSH